MSAPTGASEVWPLVVVGGGPAGIAAATEAARTGLRCLLIDEAPRIGGQIYRDLPREFTVHDRRRLGRDHRRGDRLRAGLAEVGDLVEVRSGTTVLDIVDGRRLVCSSAETGPTEVIAERLVLATGAYDRPVPFPGWTLPGVITAGGTQALLKAMRVRPGERALVAGTGPLLLVVAGQLHRAGVRVVALLEAGRSAFTAGTLVRARRQWGMLTDGARYRFDLLRAGIPIRYNHTVFQAHGDGMLDSVTYGPVAPADWRPIREQASRVEVDLLVSGFASSPAPNSASWSAAGWCTSTGSAAGFRYATPRCRRRYPESSPWGTEPVSPVCWSPSRRGGSPASPPPNRPEGSPKPRPDDDAAPPSAGSAP
ncbi:NAD(P)/FAD-dependent oxidoreductase [Micromonospora sagamiensis]|uniref:Hydrogen cyanide synthase HcnB n=1 Tax=Micromonospora sagamiensis TaxID=47875 RepID=A0A562W8W8_9ACTN|nr:FAD/NAD(P)-binding oxidoreductase [Micromonospora sagamiensis]TWJ26548.1 hydrogen cyanide synthase HcnB [Micromonospora sagamiensis]